LYLELIVRLLSLNYHKVQEIANSVKKYHIIFQQNNNN